MENDMDNDIDRKLSIIEEIEKNKRKELKIDIDEKLEPDSECCIYRVPKELREINKAAYTPHLISIGPFHHGNEDLIEMEKQKVRYKKEFGERMIEENWEDFITFIEKEEQHIRNCYSETSHLQSLDFISMVLYDAVFIIELFLKFWEHVLKKEPSLGFSSEFQECKNDFLLNITSLSVGLKRDLQLLENQLPYFVLEELYKSTKFKVQWYPPDFLGLASLFLHDSMCSEEELTYHSKVNHFTDSKRNELLQIYPQEYGSFSDLPSAVKLNESGVKFTCIKGGCLANIEGKKRFFFKISIPYFSGVELKIPHLKVVDSTETVIRNIMAFEQCHYSSETHVCNYISFMDFLINTEKDVDLLIEKGIIFNLMGDSATIVQMFNRLGLNINLSASCYSGIVKELNAHYSNGWNHKRATLKRVYFSNLWKGTGTIAAIILLLLTFIQTICSIKQVM